MAVLHVLCGMPGSGKTTLAKRLEASERALRLSPDEWLARIVGDGWDTDKRTAVHGVQYDVARRALELGVNVVLEGGFWAKSERDEMRAIARETGAGFRLHFLDVPLEELKRRIAKRNADLPPGSFHIDPDVLDEWIAEFEPPDAAELAEQFDP
jgi:predicted kinase